MWSRLHHSRTRSCSTATSAPPLTRPCTPRCRLMISGHRSDEQRRLNSTTMNMSTPVVGAARARAQEWPWLRARRVDAVNRSFRYRRSAPVSLLPPSRPRRCSPTHRTRRVLQSQDDIEGHAHRGPCPVCQPLEGHQEVRRKPPILPDRCRASLKPRVSGAMPTALLTSVAMVRQALGFPPAVSGVRRLSQWLPWVSLLLDLEGTRSQKPSTLARGCALGDQHDRVHDADVQVPRLR